VGNSVVWCELEGERMGAIDTHTEEERERETEEIQENNANN